MVDDRVRGAIKQRGGGIQKTETVKVHNMQGERAAAEHDKLVLPFVSATLALPRAMVRSNVEGLVVL